MTTFYPFVPSNQAPPQFTTTLDGQQYTATVTWNLFGQRYYVNIATLTGELVVSLPLIGSPTGVNLAALAWSQGTVTATAAAPHGYAIGQTFELTISGATPDGFNGIFPCLIVSDTEFTYAVSAFPGTATVYGVASYDIDLAEGYFASTLVFRDATQQFEVSP